MSEMEKKLFTFADFAHLIVQRISFDKGLIISISGPSCVGKSTLAKVLKGIIQNLIAVQVICIDNYLKTRYKSKVGFRNNVDSILDPEVFDWQLLKMHIENLKQGNTVSYDAYIRGVGWGQLDYLMPCKVIILEGLFLDSTQASNYIDSNLLIEMNADDDLIRKLRFKRDEYYRKNFKNFQRSESESLKEISNTIIANKIYERAERNYGYVKILVKSDFLVEIVDSKMELAK